jgi:alkylhydroperoxidase family enzyme
MFIVKPITVEESSGELKALYRKIQKVLGFVPPHFELFATFDMNSLNDFVRHNLYFARHPKIDAKLLPFLRLCIAQKECRRYCVDFNTKILKANGVNDEILNDVCSNIDKLPFDFTQKLLLSKVIYAIYNAEKFDTNDLGELYEEGFSDKDFYELLGYAANFMAKSKIIDIYLK